MYKYLKHHQRTNEPTNQRTNQATKQPSRQANKQPSNQADKQTSNQPNNQTSKPNKPTTQTKPTNPTKPTKPTSQKKLNFNKDHDKKNANTNPANITLSMITAAERASGLSKSPSDGSSTPHFAHHAIHSWALLGASRFENELGSMG
jgi:hypothetical protein